MSVPSAGKILFKDMEIQESEAPLRGTASPSHGVGGLCRRGGLVQEGMRVGLERRVGPHTPNSGLVFRHRSQITEFQRE